jgi:hypothetical protein
MRSIDIQFANRPSRIRRMRVAAGTLGALTMALSVGHYTQTRKKLEQAEADLREAAVKIEQRKVSQPTRAAVTIPEDKIRATNAAITKLNLPWPELFAALESSKPNTVALLSLQPEGKNRTLLVEAESKTPEHMLAFVKRLRAEPMFEDAFLTRHELREQDPNKPYRFALELRWRETL